MPIDPRIWGFSPDMGDLGDTLAGGVTNFMDNRAYKNAVKAATNPDGSIDYKKLQDNLHKAGMPDKAIAVAGTDDRWQLGLEFDDAGNAYRLNAAGGMQQVFPPGGGKFVQPGQWLNTGTGYKYAPKYGPGWGGQSGGGAPQSGADPSGAAPATPTTVPIDIEGRKRAEALGNISGETEGTMPDTLNNVQNAIQSIDLALQHPGRGDATGKSAWLDPRNYFGGTEPSSYREGVLKEVTGQSFLSSIQQMRGLGHLSDAEGKAATQALASLNTAQSDEDHESTLRRLKAILLRGAMRAHQKARMQPGPELVGKWKQAEEEAGYGASGGNDGIIDASDYFNR